MPDPAPRSPWSDGLGLASVRSAQTLLVLALAYVLVYALTRVTLIVIPVLIALILAAAIAPLVTRLKRRGWPAAAATGVSFFGMLAVFGGVITGIVFAVRSEWPTLVEKAGAGFDQLYAFVKNGPFPVNDAAIQDARDKALEFLGSSAFTSGALTGLGAATEFATGFVLMAVVLFYFLKDGGRIWAFLLRVFPRGRRAQADLAGIRSLQVLGGYVRGTAAVAGIDAVVIGGALLVMQVPLALPLAVVTFIGGFIPMVGATAAGALAVLVALVSNGPAAALIVLAVVVGVNQLEGNFLQPVLMGNALKVHGLVILLALTAGTILAGIVGAVLAVPLAAVAWAIIKVWTGEDAGEPQPEPEDEAAPEEPAGELEPVP
ncbi:AI-2E family transporter [Arthrobacter mobilis]|uniref:AI-2E family transporter n=1 Tax=Arthrobacter mobilis TaxID=2724944 RepID=A0A7X6HC93_9MICC|nr:AI-2E family transporter [Arthrobacter mobilis]NKX54461.1 AI-2E family transporter [Arthrobacter mobilis]